MDKGPQTKHVNYRTHQLSQRETLSSAMPISVDGLVIFHLHGPETWTSSLTPLVHCWVVYIPFSIYFWILFAYPECHNSLDYRQSLAYMSLLAFTFIFVSFKTCLLPLVLSNSSFTPNMEFVFGKSNIIMPCFTLTFEWFIITFRIMSKLLHMVCWSLHNIMLSFFFFSDLISWLSCLHSLIHP